MHLSDMQLETTAILFFDLLNGYYHAAAEADKVRMKPMVENAVRLMTAGREARVPICFAKTNHRPDGSTNPPLLTDTEYRLQPWPEGVVTKRMPPVVAGD